MIKKGAFVEIVQEVLSPEDRAHNLPEETKCKPLMLWAKGILQEDSCIGEEAEIKTVCGRLLKGVITEENPRFIHDFGDYVPEVMYIGPQAKSILWGDDNE